MTHFLDRAIVGGLKKTQEGYLVATAKVARTGIQDYHASELGMDGDRIVKILRPASEVFSTDSLASLTRVPVTVDHPAESVTADNWKDLAVGEVGDSYARDGEWIVVNPMIKDGAALLKAETTHREISMGYTADLRDAAPETGADYEMHNIKFNHLAIVPKGRAGSQARFGDAQWGATPINLNDRKDSTLDMVKLMVGDKAVQVAASDADIVTGLVRDHAAAIATKDTKIGELTAELADANAKVLTDAQVADLVAAKVEADKKLEAVKAKWGDEAVKDASPAMIDGMFRVIDKAVDDTARVVFGDKKVIEDSESRILAAQRKFLNLEQK